MRNKKSEGRLILSYLRAHLGIALFVPGCALCFYLVVYLHGVPAEPVMYASALCMAAGAVCVLPGYWRFRRRYRALELVLHGLPESRDRLPAPVGAVEEGYQEAVQQLCTLLAQSETTRRRERADSADYFTTWIHQIKTPIAAMQLILREEDTARSRELSAELFRIDRYAEMALTYARLESPSGDLVLTQVALEPVVRRVVRQYAAQFVRRRIALKCEIAPITALTDEKWLAFILGQILSNAVKYTESGAVTVRVTEDALLSVSDTGIGIAPEDLPRVFEKGFTGYNGRAGRKSTGLGMYLSRRAAEMLGHSLSVQSAPGQGSTFTLDLRRNEVGIE